MSRSAGRPRFLLSSARWLALAAMAWAGMRPEVALARPAPAAVDVVESLASQAMAAFKAGQFERAIELYLAAYQQDQSQAVLLFNAARVAHAAGWFDRAEELYQRVQAHPQAAADKKAAAQTYLLQLRRDRAETAAAQAQRLADQGRHAEAAAAWRTAYRQQPERLDWLLAAARANKQAGEFLLAEKDYLEYLERAPPSPARGDAQAELAALRQKRQELARAAVPPPLDSTPTAPAEPRPAMAKAQAPAAAPAKPVALVAAPQPAAPRSAWPVVALASGAAVAAGGVALWSWTWTEERALLQAVQPGATPTLSYEQAGARAAVLERRYQLGIGLAAAGAALAGVGWYRSLRAGEAGLTVAASPAGVALVGRW